MNTFHFNSLMTILFSFLSLWTPLLAQNELKQSISGRIVDQESNYPLVGVTVNLNNTQQNKGVISDEDGRFILTDIPIGRVHLQFSYVGYQPLKISNILVNSGKETFLDVAMEESILQLEEVTVKASEKATSVNELVAVSNNLLRVDEVIRYAGTNGDVARMAQNYAGISGASDDRNDIIVRGNSPSSVLWRLEGIDIPSPNHWATLGTSGGPVSMLNTNNLRTSDFISGAFPAEYGNATGAVFDLKLRNGNTHKYEFLGQIGFNGFEAGAEGPLKNIGKNASFLVNYRYSTLGLVNALGIDFGTGFAVPKYQDINFKINIPTEQLGKFSFWGLGGISRIQFLAEASDENLFTAGDENLEAGTNTGMIGFNHLYFFNAHSSSSLSLLFSKSHNQTQEEELIPDLSTERFEPTFLSSNIQDKYAVNWTYNHKLNAQNRIKLGLNYELFFINVADSIRLDNHDWFRELDFKDNTSLARAFAHWKYKISPKLTLNTGVNVLLFNLNHSFSFEPRINLSYQFNPQSSIGLAYGKHAQIQPLPIYFSKDDDATLIENEQNSQLDFIKSHHFVLSFNQSFKEKFSFKAEIYYQDLFSIASDPNDPDFSVINFGADFGFPNRVGLTNEGTGHNYGLEITLNKNLEKGFYFLLTSSVFNSQYRGDKGKLRNTYYNSNYILNGLIGKEFRLNDKFSILVDSRFTYGGGRRYTPIDLAASIEFGEEILEDDQTFAARLAPYIRPDLKIGFKAHTRQQITHSFSVDFQNFINRENELYKSFKESENRIKTNRQRGFFPDVRYQILF